MNNISLGIKAYLFRNVTSAVMLAENRRSPGNIRFAEKLLCARQSSSRFNRDKIIEFMGRKVSKGEKYDVLYKVIWDLKKIQIPEKNIPGDRDILKTRLTELQQQLLPSARRNLGRYFLSSPAQSDKVPDECRINRFEDIGADVFTRVGNNLNANRVVVNENNLAIASQYPLKHQIENHLKMLVDNRTPVMAVLASRQEIDDSSNQMPDYFTKSNRYPCGVNTQSTLMKTELLGDGVEANVYRLDIHGYDKSISTHVLHVHNWPDKTALSSRLTKKLARTINKWTENGVAKLKEQGSLAANDPDKMLPVVHCRAGVGRTGQIIAAMAMDKQDKQISLEKIVTDMRNTRSGFMVQKDRQLDVLVEIAEQQGRPLIENKGA